MRPQEKSVITLKDEGCKPARELDKTVAVMQKGIETIEARQLEDRETLTIILEEVRKQGVKMDEITYVRQNIVRTISLLKQPCTQAEKNNLVEQLERYISERERLWEQETKNSKA